VCFGLCVRQSLLVEGDPVCVIQEVLPDRRHRKLGVGSGDIETTGAMEAELEYHRAKALLDPKRAFSDQRNSVACHVDNL
jgi:hypothetical protein